MPRFRRNSVLATVGVLAAVTLFVIWPVIVRAFNPQPEPPARFGMAGLALAQTARLNAVNVSPPPDDGRTDPPEPNCEVTLGFVDGNGQVFVDRSGREMTGRASLGPGQAAYLDMRSGEVLGTERRVQFRAGLEFFLPPVDPDMPDPCRNIVATLEIFDTFTGRTMVLYHPPDPGSPPPDDSLPR